jgi:hypothetical protein
MKIGTQKKINAAGSSRDRAGLRARIEARAYHLWLADGGRHGNDLHYWLQAEREVINTNPTRPDR